MFLLMYLISITDSQMEFKPAGSVCLEKSETLPTMQLLHPSLKTSTQTNKKISNNIKLQNLQNYHYCPYCSIWWFLWTSALSLSQAMLCSQELLINYSRGNIVIMVRDDGKSRCETNNDNCDGNKAYDGFSCSKKGSQRNNRLKLFLPSQWSLFVLHQLLPSSRTIITMNT